MQARHVSCDGNATSSSQEAPPEPPSGSGLVARRHTHGSAVCCCLFGFGAWHRSAPVCCLPAELAERFAQLVWEKFKNARCLLDRQIVYKMERFRFSIDFFGNQWHDGVFQNSSGYLYNSKPLTLSHGQLFYGRLLTPAVAFCTPKLTALYVSNVVESLWQPSWGKKILTAPARAEQ